MIKLLDKEHNRDKFDCGNELLNNYLKYQVSQDVKRKLAACFILADQETNHVKGFYTLSSGSIPLTYFPETIRKKLPKSYGSIPTILLGRLAIDKNSQGKGFGKLLLIDALKRSLMNTVDIGSFAVVVDPIDKIAEDFYAKYDFIKLPDSGKMFLPTKTLQILFSQ